MTLSPKGRTYITVGAGGFSYPFAQQENPQQTRYITHTPDRSVILSYQPRGLEYWKVLSEALANEPVEDHDRFFWRAKKASGQE